MRSGSTRRHALTASNSSLTHPQPTSFGPQITLARLTVETNKQKSERVGDFVLKDNLQDPTRPLRNATESCSMRDSNAHTRALTFSRSLRLALYFSLDSLSALTTDGVLIKSSRNITVSKQCSACQFRNCRVLIQALTCSIQIGREPSARAPTGSSRLARSCAVPRRLASPRKVNCGPCHASWHWV